jgi:hypothetical protein
MRNGKMLLCVPRALSGAVLALALVLAVGACGSSGSPSSVAVSGPLANAANVTSQTRGAHMTLSAHIEGASAQAAVTVTGSGFFNYAGHEGMLTLKLAGLPADIAAGSSSTIEEIYKGTDVYIGSSLLAGKLPGGARWMKLDLARVGEAAGINPAQLLGGQSNPASLLEYLKASGGSVQAVGNESVRGVLTTHYRGTIDLRKLAKMLPGSHSAAAREAFEKSLTQLGLTSLPVDVWADSQHLVRRIELALSAPAGGQQTGVRVTIELFGFGATPAVNVPASSETFDATSSALSGLSALGG